MSAPLLTYDQAAAQLAVSRRTVMRLAKRRAISVVRIGASTRIEPAELDRYIAARRTGNAADAANRIRRLA